MSTNKHKDNEQVSISKGQSEINMSRSATPQQPSRRRALHALGAVTGAALVAPERWSKPVVNAIILPAHAQTSPGLQCMNAVVPLRTAADPAGSGSFCTIDFSFFAEADTPALTITAIDVAGLGMDDTLEILTTLPQQVDMMTGVELRWSGVADDAPFSCLVPSSDATITVTATCDGAEDYVDVFTLSSIAQA